MEGPPWPLSPPCLGQWGVAPPQASSPPCPLEPPLPSTVGRAPQASSIHVPAPCLRQWGDHPRPHRSMLHPLTFESGRATSTLIDQFSTLLPSTMGSFPQRRLRKEGFHNPFSKAFLLQDVFGNLHNQPNTEAQEGSPQAEKSAQGGLQQPILQGISCRMSLEICTTRPNKEGFNNLFSKAFFAGCIWKLAQPGTTDY